MANIFSIKLDHTDSKTKLIACEEKGLLIKVLSKRMNSNLEPEDSLLLTAEFYDETKPALEMVNQVKSLHFLILNIKSPNSRKWNRDLFFEAIDFYCVKYLKLANPTFRYDTGLKWYAFEPVPSLDEDDFDCIAPAAIVQPTPEQLKNFILERGLQGDGPK